MKRAEKDVVALWASGMCNTYRKAGLSEGDRRRFVESLREMVRNGGTESAAALLTLKLIEDPR